ncbi:response regulator [Rubrivirga marina]|uniref:DNA-binding response regulator n=1 Tax=Rubrivirga marina TaxID=1196024 RepID=A0A271J457_9BACT|nr:response regulator transcription factor [Rubrivirga marina]PAP77735.1 DNA-binding response regulator [Rubrivirga marina]
MTRIVIADDHVLVRRGLAELLREMDDFRVVGEASSGDELLRLVRDEHVDVVVMDMSMPGPSGLDLVKSIKAEFPKLPLLVLSAHPEDQYAVRVVRAGAMGYLTKESAEADLVDAVRRVASGKRYLTQTLAASLLDALDADPDEDPHAALSDREYQVLRLIASGMTVGGIAEHLSLSVKTVSTYRSRLLQKMGMSNNSEITRYALENGLVE